MNNIVAKEASAVAPYASEPYVIDIDEVRRQLTALGYKKGDRVFLRGFYPSFDERKAGAKAECNSSDEVVRIAYEWSNQGMGVYIVVNGGGHTDAEVAKGRAIFYEHDDLPKELQFDLWKKLELPMPTFQVDTGGKSIHSYWVFNEPIDIKDWRQLQIDLLVMSAGDQKIKNPSRVMRLAGAWHFSEAGANQSRIVSATGKRYSFEELRGLIPIQKVEQAPLLTTVPTGDVPLEVCLSKADRELIDGGVGEGGRNSTGAKLARNLIGTAVRLQYLGIRYDGDPRNLFDTYCSRCNPPLDTRESDQIYKSAYKDNPSPTLTDDAIINCVKAWQRKQQLNTSTKNHLCTKSIVSADNSELSVELSVDKINDESIIQAIVSAVSGILGSNFGEFLERKKLNDIYSTYKDVIDRKLFDSIVASERVRFNEVLPEDEIRLKSLMDFAQVKINWDEVLPAPLARDIKHDADVLNIDAVMIWQALLSAVSSLAGGVTLDEYGGVPCINWTCTVLPSGGGKTRADKLVFAPLRQLQRESDDRYKEDLKQYKRDFAGYEKSEDENKEEPEKPALRQYIMEIATIQGVTRRLSEQGEGKGSLWARDEIKGLFESLKQFSGDSEAQEILLKLWDKVRGNVIRADFDNCYSYDGALSLTGGIQDDVFRKVFKDVNDANGMQARFLFACPETRKKRYTQGYCNLSDRLPVLYNWLNELGTETIKLAPKAQKYFAQLVSEIGDQIEQVSHAGIRTWMNKLDTHVLRIALALHLIECFYVPSATNFKEISIETLKRAVSFAQYYRSTFHILQEKVSVSDDIASIMLQIHTAALTRHPDGISARDVYRPSTSIQTRAKAAGREVGAYVVDLFEKMAQLGYGEVVRRGKAVRFIAFKNFSLEKTSKGTDSTDNSTDSEIKPLQEEEKNCQCPPLTISIVSADNQNNTEVRTDAECPSKPDDTPLDSSISLLQIEQSEGDVNGFIGMQAEVRNISGAVKFAGELTSYDSLNGTVKITNSDGEVKGFAVRETFVL